MEIDSDLKKIRTTVTQITVKHDLRQQEVARLQGIVEKLNDGVLIQTQVLKLLQEFSEQLQTVVQDDVSSFVTEGLKSVFDRDKKFKLRFGLYRNQVEVKMTLDASDTESLPLEGAQSGGVVDTASWLLRLWVVLRLSQLGYVDKVLLLDEPFTHLSPKYVVDVAYLMSSLSKRLGVQCLFITQNPTLAARSADNVHRVSLQAGEVKVEDDQPVLS